MTQSENQTELETKENAVDEPSNEAPIDDNLENDDPENDDPENGDLADEPEAEPARSGPSLVDVLRSSRLLMILAALVVTQVVLVAVVFLLPRGGGAEEASPLLPDVTVDTVNSVTIADDVGESIALAREGDGWVLPEADNYPATGSSVDALIGQIGELETGTVIAETASSHARLQVAEDEFARRIDLGLGDNGATLFIGSTAGGGASHVRTGDSDTVYLSDGISSLDANAAASNWIDTLYFSVPQPDVQTLTLTNISGTVEFVRGADGTLALADLGEGETFNENNLTSLLTTLSSVNLVAPIGLADNQGFSTGFGAGATVVVETQSAEGATATQTLQVGEQLENGNYAVTSSESEYAVEVAPFTVESLLTRARSDFLSEPPASTPLTGTAPLTDTGSLTETAPSATDTESLTNLEVTTDSVVTTPTEVISEGDEITPGAVITNTAPSTETETVTGG